MYVDVCDFRESFLLILLMDIRCRSQVNFFLATLSVSLRLEPSFLYGT